VPLVEEGALDVELDEVAVP
jgi:hypothetical protein